MVFDWGSVAIFPIKWATVLVAHNLYLSIPITGLHKATLK
jgi:hypothetical protein